MDMEEESPEEGARIRALYESDYTVTRGESWWNEPWSERNLRAVYYRHMQERVLIRGLNECRVELQPCEILDIGCGNGWVLRFLASLGAEPHNLHGVDLVEERIGFARHHSPRFQFSVADARELPFETDSFDVVCQFTALSSFTEDRNRAAFVREMLRVLRPGGYVLWFEITKDLPGARTRAVSASERTSMMANAYPVFQQDLFHRQTYRLARWPVLCMALEAFPLPKTNEFAILQKAGA